MQCEKCGKRLPPGERFCSDCGITASVPKKDTAAAGAKLIAAGVIIFVVCCIIQAACGSSMFSINYYSGGFVADMLINVTFYPGWIASLSFIVIGIWVCLKIAGKK